MKIKLADARVDKPAEGKEQELKGVDVETADGRTLRARSMLAMKAREQLEFMKLAREISEDKSADGTSKVERMFRMMELTFGNDFDAFAAACNEDLSTMASAWQDCMTAMNAGESSAS